MSLATLLVVALCAINVFGYYSVPGMIYGKQNEKRAGKRPTNIWNRAVPSLRKYHRVFSWGPHSRPDFLVTKRNTDDIYHDNQLVQYRYVVEHNIKDN